MSDRTLVNFRLPRALLAEIDAAAARAGLNRTEWVASTLTLAARAELHATVQSVAAGAGGSPLPTSVPVAVGPSPSPSPHLIVDGCPHPRHRRSWARRGLICLECSSVLESASHGA